MTRLIFKYLHSRQSFLVFLHGIRSPLCSRPARVAQRKVCAGVAAVSPPQRTPSFIARRSPASTTGETGPPKKPCTLAGTRQSMLIENHAGVIVSVCVEPARLILPHVDAAVASVSCKCLVTAAVIVREVRSRTIIRSPPAIVEVVATPVVLHRVVDLGVRIPECRPLRFARLERRRRLAQQDVPYPRR